ncbi:hypothetical protein Ancab_010082 [Ancistrocladus abbreviatus]
MFSIFSSFEALCAESSGRKVSLSWPSSERKEERKGLSAVDGLKKDDAEKETRTPVMPKDTSSRSIADGNQITRNNNLKRNPRFAVELDGVHCFETIVPY